MSKRAMQSESTAKSESSQPPVWMSRWNRINSAEKNRITEKAVSDDHLIQTSSVSPGPSMESQSHHCVREIRPIFKLPYLFPDIKNLFSTRGYYFGQGTSTRLELMAATTHSPSPKNSLFAAMPSFNLERRIDDFRAKAAAFFPLNSSGRVNQVFDGKMKGLAESYETKDSKSDDIAGRNSLKKKKKKVLQLPGVAFLPGRRQIRVSEENYGVETTRICTAATVGSVEDDGCHRFSRTTHGLFITSGNADLSSNEGAIFRNRGIKLKQLSSCSDEEQSSRSNGENREPNSRNKSSSEMEALDVGKSHSAIAIGANSATSYKGRNNASSSSSPESKAKPISVPWMKKESRSAFVDLNEELPDDSHEPPDPADRWVKRLKLNSSFENSAEPNGKTVRDGDSDSSSSSTTGSMNHSATTAGGGSGKPPPPLLSTDRVFSETWIRRLMRKREADGDSRSKSKLPESRLLDDEKPFPSIAAMALVGRAMNCVPSYEVRNEGSLTFWNA